MEAGEQCQGGRRKGAEPDRGSRRGQRGGGGSDVGFISRATEGRVEPGLNTDCLVVDRGARELPDGLSQVVSTRTCRLWPEGNSFPCQTVSPFGYKFRFVILHSVHLVPVFVETTLFKKKKKLF